MLSTRSRGGYTATSPRTFVRVSNSRGTNQQTHAKASTSAATYTRCATANSTSLSTAVSQGRREKHGPVIRKNCPNKTHGCPWRGPEDELQHHINYDCLYQKVECSVCKKTLLRGNILGHRNSCPQSRLGCNWEGLCQGTALSDHLNVNFSRDNWLTGCRFIILECIYCGERHMRGELIDKLKKKLPKPDIALRWIYEATHQEASDKWFNIGLNLNIPYGILNQIKLNNRDRCGVCYREMLATWLNQVRPTAGDLVNSLRASSVGKDALAEDFEKAIVCDDAIKKKLQSKIEKAERMMEKATDQCQTMAKLQIALRTINRKLERNKDYLKDQQKQLNIRRRELQAAKGGDPKFFNYTQQKIEEIEGTVQASVDSIETLNDQIREEERERRELIQQILQCKNDIEDTTCKLSTLRDELRRNSQQLKREEKLLIEKIKVILQDPDDIAAAAGTTLGWLATMAGGIGGSMALTVGGLPVAAAGFGYLAYKRYNHPGEREKRKIRSEYLELTRRCKMTAENIGQAIKGCQSNLDNMKDLIYEEDSETDEFWR